MGNLPHRPIPYHQINPNLLNGKVLRYSKQIWSTDLTYIKLPGIGYVYLVAIIDIYSGKVLSWKISNGMDNQDRFHQSLDYETPNMRYESFQEGYAVASCATLNIFGFGLEFRACHTPWGRLCCVHI